LLNQISLKAGYTFNAQPKLEEYVKMTTTTV